MLFIYDFGIYGGCIDGKITVIAPDLESAIEEANKSVNKENENEGYLTYKLVTKDFFDYTIDHPVPVNLQGATVAHFHNGEE